MDPQATQTQADDTAIIPMTAEDMYNLVMGQIEPELTTWITPHLDEMYAHETPLEREERAKRYKAALQEFATRFEEAAKNWHEDLEWIKEHAFIIEKNVSAKADSDEIASIEHSIDNQV
jgi:hypothetical protein